MNMISKTTSRELQWFAVRMKRPQNPSRRTTVIGADFEAYVTRKGMKAKRRVKDTGKRVFVAEHILRGTGFDVFLPVKKVWRIKNRCTREKQLLSFPLLVDWIFVGWPVGECRWLDLMQLDVVAGVLGTGGHPIQIPAGRVMCLMRKWGGGYLSPDIYRYMRTGHEYSVGDTVRVADGPLDGQEVRVIEINGPSVKAVLEMLGGDIEVEIQSDLLESVK